MPNARECRATDGTSIASPNLPVLAYTVDETAEVIKCHRSYVYKLISEGKLDTITLGRRRLVKAGSVHALFDQAA